MAYHTIRLHQDDYDRIEEIKQEEGQRSIAATIRVLIADYKKAKKGAPVGKTLKSTPPGGSA